jgi:hypothetical protein
MNGDDALRGVVWTARTGLLLVIVMGGGKWSRHQRYVQLEAPVISA